MIFILQLVSRAGIMEPQAPLRSVLTSWCLWLETQGCKCLEPRSEAHRDAEEDGPAHQEDAGRTEASGYGRGRENVR